MSSVDLPIKVYQSLRIPTLYTILILSALIGLLSILHSLPYIETLWRAAIGIALFFLGYAFLKRKTTWYVLDALEIIEHSGIILHKVKRIPLNRITNYETQAKILEKISGLGRLAIDTPGGGGFEMILKEVPKAKLVYFMEALSVLLAEQKVIDAGDDVTIARKRKEALSEKMESIEAPTATDQ